MDPRAPLGGRIFLKNVMVMTRMGRLVPSEKDGGEEKSGRKNGKRGGNGGVRAGASLSESRLEMTKACTWSCLRSQGSLLLTKKRAGRKNISRITKTSPA